MVQVPGIFRALGNHIRIQPNVEVKTEECATRKPFKIWPGHFEQYRVMVKKPETRRDGSPLADRQEFGAEAQFSFARWVC
jgi:hypothetical protein